jgi:two-component sensor histidine kinase
MAPRNNEAATNLTLAVVTTSMSPLLLLDSALVVVAASRSFCQEFGVDPGKVIGCPIFSLGSGEWEVRQLRSLLATIVAGKAEIDAYEMDLTVAGKPSRRLIVHAQRLDYGDDDNIMVSLAISDVTDARMNEKLKDDLLAERSVLLRELQHRVANSLQIIASILLLSARRVQSEETRAHLQAAHGRVMSLAAVQEQLAQSSTVDVDVRSYFTQLCESLAASMIRDPEKASIEVRADGGTLTSEVSVSLGLIVTELVINSLKHAFPTGEGKITVAYRVNGSDWTLSVGDDGIGMPASALKTKAGLGSSLVEALAKQLNARILVADAAPGTLVSIVHASSGSSRGASATPALKAV